MYTIDYITATRPTIKKVSKNPDTGDLKIVSEELDKVNDELLSHILNQSIDKKR